MRRIGEHRDAVVRHRNGRTGDLTLDEVNVEGVEAFTAVDVRCEDRVVAGCTDIDRLRRFVRVPEIRLESGSGVQRDVHAEAFHDVVAEFNKLGAVLVSDRDLDVGRTTGIVADHDRIRSGRKVVDRSGRVTDRHPEVGIRSDAAGTAYRC